MSEVKNETKTERTPYKLEIDNLDFTPDFSGKYLTSKDFCNLTNQFFRAAFADYVGSQFEIVNGQPTVSIYFDHAKTADGVYACERISDKSVGNVTMDKIRNRDLQMKDGDRYHLTEDGEDIIKELLLPRFYNQGKINWKSVVSDVADRTAASYYQPQTVQQMTKVVGIDPVALCKVLYGNVDKTADTIEPAYLDYMVSVKANLTQGMPNMYPNYLLEITQAFTGVLTKTYEKLGIGGIGSSIIR